MRKTSRHEPQLARPEVWRRKQARTDEAALICKPRGLPDAISSRTRSPAATCCTLSAGHRSEAYVPLPTPGAPISIQRRSAIRPRRNG